jgi:serine protease Do
MPKSFASLRRPLIASAAAIAVASGAVAFSMSPATFARAEALQAPASVENNAPSFADVVSHVKPAVVSVKVNIEDAVASDDEDGEQGQGEIPPEMQQFFKHFSPGMNFGKPIMRHGVALGSGFIISADGYVVTNNHVVEHGGKEVTVTLDSGKEVKAKVVGTDAKTDLALLKMEEGSDYPYVKFAKTQPRIGDWVLAIGNPFGLGGTVTAGIVSAEGRDIGSGPYDQFIQIDAPINKGNSGGPTFNLKGEVVGVNTAIFSPSGGSVGLGFAIPASTVDMIVGELEHGGVHRGYLGVQIQPVTQDLAEGLGLKTNDGALVAETQPDTPAASAGLKSGDVIVKLNGDDVKSAGDLTRKVAALKPGEKAQVTYVRNGETKTADVTLAALPGEKVASAEHGDASEKSALTLGVQLAPSESGKGVQIVGVDPTGQAASKGISAGDVILEVAGKPVTSPNQVKSEIQAAKKEGKKAVLMLVKTPQASRFVAFEFPKA